jgi:hypothetical protein
MNSRISTVALLIVSAIAVCGRALADCPLGSAYDAGKAYEKGQALEAQGKKAEALEHYVRAQAEVCDPVNPYRAPAAKRGAPLGLELGTAAEKAGDFFHARGFYEMGGHYARADLALMHTVRAEKDNPSEYVNARAHFENRARLAAATSKTTTPYSPDPKLVAEVNAMPKQAIDRAWKQEQGAYNEHYLADFVQLTQNRVVDPTDMAATQRSSAAQSEFLQKWHSRDLVTESLDALEMMRRWAAVTDDAALQKSTLALAGQRADQHAQILVQKYSGAPALLEKAIAFVPMTGAEQGKAAARIAGIKAQAVKLGDEANARENYLLAIGYYRAGGDQAKAEATQAKATQLMKQKLQPTIDKAQAQAEDLKKQFSDPAKVQAMREQAEAAKKAIQQQQAQSATQSASRKKSTDDLEKELGL